MRRELGQPPAYLRKVCSLSREIDRLVDRAEAGRPLSDEEWRQLDLAIADAARRIRAARERYLNGLDDSSSQPPR
jgi:hypothetical protein